jgi:hypothetical protein
MSIYSVNFSQLWATLTPPVLKKPMQLVWGTVLMKPIQYIRDLVFDDYADGSPYSIYSNASVYTTDDRVVFIDRGVYESISGSTGILPNDVNYWNKVNDNYIGVRERIKYNSQKVLFEYGLNRWFQCSGIYIDNTPYTSTGFLMGQTGEFSSTLSNISTSINISYLNNTGYSGYTSSSYTIFVPNVVYTGLSSTQIESENIVRSFADKYNLAGIQYSVSGY